ncbi:unnamed protein product [Peniophora sp. CBMAI 1063]|nr:unnamed protein product [Peniophora sp. CBMAI 1063]
MERSIFTSQEIKTKPASHRRTIYQASLEAYINELHEKLYAKGCYPIPLENLVPWEGLSNKTAKGLLAGLQHDSTQKKQKLAEIERANLALRDVLKGPVD